jgi:hypothetical protein
MSNQAVLRKLLVEQISRKVCNRNYQLDPDQMVYCGTPQVLRNLGNFPLGILVPSPSFQMKAWELFAPDVEMIIDELEKNV